MPDLDDLFEDLVDGVKKQWRKRKKARKQRQKARKENARHTPRQATPNRPNGSRSQVSGAPQHSPTVTQDAKLRAYLDQAHEYQAGLLELARNAPNDFNRSRLDNLSRHIDHWQNSLAALVQQVELFRRNPLLQRDLKTVPKAIARLEEEIADAPSPKIRQALERTLTNRQQQLATLRELDNMTRWAEVKIENTVSVLGSIYSQSLMSQSTGQVGDYRRLLVEIEEEARALDDYVSTLAEVKLGSDATSVIGETAPA